MSLLDRKFRCAVTCPVCGVQLMCIKLICWKFSNLIKHLRAHKIASQGKSAKTRASTSASPTQSTGSVTTPVIHRSNELALGIIKMAIEKIEKS